jgi:hypothetical protein
MRANVAGSMCLSSTWTAIAWVRALGAGGAASGEPVIERGAAASVVTGIAWARQGARSGGAAAGPELPDPAEGGGHPTTRRRPPAKHHRGTSPQSTPPGHPSGGSTRGAWPAPPAVAAPRQCRLTGGREEHLVKERAV